MDRQEQAGGQGKELGLSDLETLSAQFLATLIGVVTGPAALLLSVLNYLRDRAALHVDVRINMLVKNAANYNDGKRHIVVTVTNIGRRPAYISLVGLLFPDGTNYTLSDILFNPKHAKEGEAPCQFLCEQEGIENFNEQWPGVYCLVRTSTGLQFRSRFLQDVPTGGNSVNWLSRQKLRFSTLLHHKWALKKRLIG
jgi:hypothetical protein